MKDADRSRPRRPPLVAVIILILGLAMTTEFALSWSAFERASDQDRLMQEASRIRTTISTELNRHQDALRGLAGVVSISDELSHGEFHRFVSALRTSTRFPGLDGIALLTPTRAGRAEVALSAGTPHYPLPVGTQASATFAPTITLAQARDTGRSAIGPPSTFGSDAGKTGGSSQSPTSLSLFVPIYETTRTPRTLDARREQLVGWITAPFVLDRVLAQRLPNMAGEVFVEVFDGPTTRPEARLTAWVNDPGEPGRQLTMGLIAIDRPWELRVAALPGLGQADGRMIEPLIWIGGIAMTLLAFGLLWALGRARDQALCLVDRRTHTLRESEARFRTLAAASPVGIVETTPHGVPTYFNDRFLTLTGQSREQAERDPWGNIDPSDRDLLSREWQAAVASCVPFEAEFRVEVAEETRWIHAQAAPVLDESGVSASYVATLHDITERIETDRALLHQATHDPLTGLPNRKLLMDRLEMASARAERSHEPLALMFLDLDHFKQINDRYGHDGGDAILAAFAERLSAAVRPSDSVARMGGDEFVVLCEGVTGTDDVENIARRIERAMEHPIQVGPHSVEVSASIGISVRTEAVGRDPEAFLKAADDAMYRVKDAGRRGHLVA